MNLKTGTKPQVTPLPIVRDLTARQKLALSARILDREGHYHGLAGQVTSRSDTESSFLTLGFGVGFCEARSDEMVEVDADMKPVRGDMQPNPGTRFHLHIYALRPDVNAIVHTHPPAVAALSMLRQELIVAHMDQTPFTGNIAYLRDWPGLPVGNEEGRIISEALGDKHIIILANHGLLTAGRTIEEATVMAVWLEHAAELQMKASAVGKPVAVKEELAAKSRDFLLSKKVVDLTFDYFARRELHLDPTITSNNAAGS